MIIVPDLHPEPLVAGNLEELFSIIALGSPTEIKSRELARVIIVMNWYCYVGRFVSRTLGLPTIVSPYKSIPHTQRGRLRNLVCNLHFKSEPFVTVTRLVFDTHVILWGKHKWYSKT